MPCTSMRRPGALTRHHDRAAGHALGVALQKDRRGIGHLAEPGLGHGEDPELVHRTKTECEYITKSLCEKSQHKRRRISYPWRRYG
jgi:hypothetical protein